jgi:hypothetical protein
VPLAHLYLHCESQWRVGFAGREGLLYSECRIVYQAHRKRLGLPAWPEALDALQLIERTMLDAQEELRVQAADRKREAEPWPGR